MTAGSREREDGGGGGGGCPSNGDGGDGCRCQPWGRCEPVPPVSAAGQPCHRHARCAPGLVCGGGGRCVPDARLEDLPRFADLPEPDLGSHADIPATYGGPLLVAAISLALVVVCLALAAWCRLTAPSGSAAAPRLHMATSSSVLISMNHLPPVPCYTHPHHCTPPHLHSHRQQYHPHPHQQHRHCSAGDPRCH